MADSYQLVYAKYGTNTTIYFPLITAGANTFKSGAGLVAGDTKISIDGAATGNSTNNPVEIGTTGVYSLALVGASELIGSNIMVIMKKAAIEDRAIQVKTSLDLGTMRVDASQTASVDAIQVTAGPTSQAFTILGGATSGDAMQISGQNGNGRGITVAGNGTGSAIDASTGNILGVLKSMSCQTGTAQSGSPTQIQLSLSASATDNIYNGAIVLIIGGTGTGEFNSVQTYSGATQLCTMSNTWVTTPNNTSQYVLIPSPSSNFVASSVWGVSEGAEPAGPIADNATFGSIMQYVKRRFMNKGTQTTAVRTIFKDDSATTLYTQDVSFDGVTEVRNKGA